MGKTKKKWMCPVCNKPAGSNGVFACLGCNPHQWVHPQCGGYGSRKELEEYVKTHDVKTLRCNNCKLNEQAKLVEPIVERVAEAESVEPIVERVAEAEADEPMFERVAEAEPVELIEEGVVEAEPGEPIVEKVAEPDPGEPIVERIAEAEAVEFVVERVAEGEPVEPAVARVVEAEPVVEPIIEAVAEGEPADKPVASLFTLACLQPRRINFKVARQEGGGALSKSKKRKMTMKNMALKVVAPKRGKVVDRRCLESSDEDDQPQNLPCDIPSSSSDKENEALSPEINCKPPHSKPSLTNYCPRQGGLWELFKL